MAGSLVEKCAPIIAILAFCACGGRANLEGEAGELADTAGVATGGHSGGGAPPPEADAPPPESTWSGEIAACCWRDDGCSNDEICVASTCWLPSAGCWADEDCFSGYHCEGANPCSCCETCRCAGPDTAGTCVLNTCTVAADPFPDIDESADDCDVLQRLALGNPRIMDEGGDGELSAGERATVTVTMHETSGYWFNVYPGVQIEVDPSLATASAMNWRYAQSACESSDYSATVEFSGVLEAGTKVILTARVAALGLDCPDAPSIEIPVVIAQ